MKRNEITVETLKAKGYRDYEFNDLNMETAVERIKNGAKCEIVPQFTGIMVARINEHDAFFREMTDEEKIQYADEMNKQREHHEKVSAKIRARQLASMRRR